MIVIKYCPECETNYPATSFSIYRKAKDGLQGRCKTCMKKYTKAHYLINKEIYIKRTRDWMKTNPEKTKITQKKASKKYKKKPINRLKKNMYNRIKKLIEAPSHCRSFTIGCTGQKLKEYIQSLFVEGMSWENYGFWHIDHIKPLSSFDLTKQEERCKANHYTNLQPLWAKDNIKKSNK